MTQTPKDIPKGGEPLEPTPPKPWDIARAGAKATIAAQGLTPAQVRALGYSQVAALCGVDPKRDKPAPEWFEYEPLKERLAVEIEEAAREASVQAIAAQAWGLFTTMIASGERPSLVKEAFASMLAAKEVADGSHG